MNNEFHILAPGMPHSTSSSHPSTTAADVVVGSVAFQGTLDISNYVDDSEDTTDTGSAASSTTGGNRGINSGVTSNFPGRTASYHYGHGGGRNSGTNTVQGAVHQHSSPHYSTSQQQYSEHSHSRIEGGSSSTPKSSLTIGTNLSSSQTVPNNPKSSHGGLDDAGEGTIPTLPPTAMTIASAEEHRKKMSALSSGVSRDGSKTSSSTSLISGSNTGASNTATIVNIEENKVKIKVPGLQQKSLPPHSSVIKQKSMNP